MRLLVKKYNFLYLSILAFVFISSSALCLSGQFFFEKTPVKNLTPQISKNFPPVPILSSEALFPIISAQGAMAVDLDSGVNLYEKNADALLLPASTTKIVTAMVALDYYPLDQILTVPKSAVVDGQKMRLYAGQEIKVEDLLYGLLVFSANDAAETLASNYPGGRSEFIKIMNEKAQELSMGSSFFANPVGFDEDGQRSTAKDLIRASEIAMRNPEFAKIVGTKQITISDASGKTKYSLKNVNDLLGTVPGVLGVKTGWTEKARENLVTYIERDGHRIMIAVLGSQDRFGETEELIDWIFASYKWEQVSVPI